MGFNTSHVILYQDSCSKEPLRKTRFNTSHVILYPEEMARLISGLMFQYISCYSLSEHQRGII